MKTLAERICNLDKFITDNNLEMIVYIKNKLLTALAAVDKFEDKQDLKNYVYQDCDPLGNEETISLEEGDALYDAVREIQLDIINED